MNSSERISGKEMLTRREMLKVLGLAAVGVLARNVLPGKAVAETSVSITPVAKRPKNPPASPEQRPEIKYESAVLRGIRTSQTTIDLTSGQMQSELQTARSAAVSVNNSELEKYRSSEMAAYRALKAAVSHSRAKINESEEERIDSAWGFYGIFPEGSQNWVNEGGRSTGATPDGEQAVYCTWNHGNFYLLGGADSKFVALPNINKVGELGVGRHIFPAKTFNESVPSPEKDKTQKPPKKVEISKEPEEALIVVSDAGVQVFKRAGDKLLINTFRPDIEGSYFFQTGGLDGQNNILIGGHGVLLRLENWQDPRNVRVESLSVPYFESPEGFSPILMRTMCVTEKGDLVVAGWIANRDGYSGWCWNKVNGARIMKPGAGAFMSQDNGQTWKQILADVNVNCIRACSLPDAVGNVEEGFLVGAEGQGAFSFGLAYQPDLLNFPSHFLGRKKGSSYDWQPLTFANIDPRQPTCPQEGFLFGPKHDVICWWGGAIIEVDKLTWTGQPQIDKPNKMLLTRGAGQLNEFQRDGQPHFAIGGLRYDIENPLFAGYKDLPRQL